MEEPKETPKGSGRGFASMTPEQRRLLGSRGGKTAHERGTANRFTPETASAAGRVPHEKGTAHKWTSDEARDAGRKGGTASRRRRRSSDTPAIVATVGAAGTESAESTDSQPKSE